MILGFAPAYLLLYMKNLSPLSGKGRALDVFLAPGGSWACECGEVHILGAYVAAHWDVPLEHTCSVCGCKRQVLSGVLTSMEEMNP